MAINTRFQWGEEAHVILVPWRLVEEAILGGIHTMVAVIWERCLARGVRWPGRKGGNWIVWSGCLARGGTPTLWCSGGLWKGGLSWTKRKGGREQLMMLV